MLEQIVKNGSHQQIRDALEKGIPFNADELTEALLAAIQREDLALVKLVLDHGADPNHIVNDCWGALHIAVEYELFDIIQLLVAHGADVNLRNHSGSTPLHIAVDLEGDSAWQTDTTPTTTLTEMLLQLGADPTIRNNAGKTPLDTARNYDHKAAIALLSSWKAK